eukprot:COSAG06_NODE_64479_length_259_cov_0.956250_1_plen_64_part_01
MLYADASHATIKLVDFGCAAHCVAARRKGKPMSDPLAKATLHKVIGTTTYMAPVTVAAFLYDSG